MSTSIQNKPLNCDKFMPMRRELEKVVVTFGEFSVESIMRKNVFPGTAWIITQYSIYALYYIKPVQL